MEVEGGEGRLYRWVGAGFVSTIGGWSDLLGRERKWVKDRTEVMNSISIHEAKGRGRGKGTKKSREVIKLEAVFHSGPRVRIATCQSLTFHLSFANQSLFSGPSNSRPRALRESGPPPPLILPLTDSAHLSTLTRHSGNLATNQLPPVHTAPFGYLESVPPSWEVPRSDQSHARKSITCSQIIGDTITITPHSNTHSAFFFFVNMVRTRCPSTLVPTRALFFLSFARGRLSAAPSYQN